MRREGSSSLCLLLLLMFLGHWQLLERPGDLRQPCLPTLLLSSPSSSLSLCLSHLLNSSSAPCLSSFFPLLSSFLSQQLPSSSSFSLLLLPSSSSFFSTPCASSRIPESLDHPHQPPQQMCTGWGGGGGAPRAGPLVLGTPTSASHQDLTGGTPPTSFTS